LIEEETGMTMLTINELAEKTGISAYEIRQRVLSGTCPHMRVGSKKTKILIDYELFTDMLKQENLSNMQSKADILGNAGNINGYEAIRQIN
jgi:hypothetical protein